jgi:undecaprenyl-diphosphatase
VTGRVSDQRIAKIPMAQAVLIGSAQILALAPGISRSGVTMVRGLLRGLPAKTPPGSRSCWRRR